MMASDDVVCAVDVGTSAVRAAPGTYGGQRLREAPRERALDEGAEPFEPAHRWAEPCRALRRLDAGDARPRLRCLAIVGRVGQVLVDERNHPLGMAGGWADSRGVREVAAGWPDRAAALRLT